MEIKQTTVKALSKKFAGQWVLVADPKKSSRTGKITSGKLLAHTKTRDELYDAALLLDDVRHFAVLCFKEPDPGTVLVL